MGGRKRTRRNRLRRMWWPGRRRRKWGPEGDGKRGRGEGPRVREGTCRAEHALLPASLRGSGELEQYRRRLPQRAQKGGGGQPHQQRGPDTNDSSSRRSRSEALTSEFSWCPAKTEGAGGVARMFSCARRSGVP